MQFIGLMSGTSADGIDAALVDFADGQCRLVHSLTHPWDADLRERLIALGQGGELQSLDEYGTLDVQVAEAFAAAAQALLRQANVDSSAVLAIGSHGQTIRHRPSGAAFDGMYPFTLQIGDPNVIAERTGITTVADFRRRDVAAGGQGAPLVPAFHAALLGDATEERAILNLGGIGNLTLLPRDGEVRGFDTGPANALMDAWCQLHTGNAYDDCGAFAASGTVDADLLQRWLSDGWFALPPPKSTGREQFHLNWVSAQLRGHENPADVQATLLALTVITVADALKAHQPTTQRVLVCGGGTRNSVLMQALRDALPGVSVQTTSELGIDSDAMEAMAFAWLAMRTLLGQPGNLQAVTGATGPRILGSIHQP
ncbi:anhydro-N-acetylmuramic acid kinase [Aquilutibacter rugosus]|uniref:anhydro-N-acetylmuramic acid kinase n=1 Tax=Aquilutibacter rugosus TaxID=3115820 RepID=UPI002F409B70